ncbi:MAG: PEP-CTERM sorting domain-containing protein [Acidobacteria bacterium]|nr:PEP-CTERM sorting domain-containing protein [Acidobacteriota bacterium]
MRKRLLFISALLLTVSGAGVKAVSASTDCDKWLREYKQQLAELQPVRKVLAVRHRNKKVVPKPKIARVSSPVHHIRTPKLSPQEMLRRFHILCGDLPPENELALVPETPLQMIVPQTLEAPASNTLRPVSSVPPVNERGQVQTPSTVTPPIGFVPGVPGQPGVPGIPIIPTTPVVPAVPEPSSIALLLTGFLGMFTLGARKILE